MRKLTVEEQTLLERAREAGLDAYCPYSEFPVGAAVQTDRGVFVGCNVENASYGMTICAERVALFTAVAAGAREFMRLAVSCISAGPDVPRGSRVPCGACRQVMAEFMPPDTMVIVDGVGVWRLADLLPEAFRLGTNREMEAES